MKQNNSFLNSGIFSLSTALFLVILGVYLIIRNIPIHPQILLYFFPAVLILAGLYWLTEFFLFQRQGILMPGLLFTILGGFMVLARWQIVPPLSLSWPLLLACIGGVLWLHALMEGLPLRPLVLLFFAGIGLYLSNMSWFSLQSLLRFWPLLLVALGLMLVFRSRRKSSDSNIENQE